MPTVAPPSQERVIEIAATSFETPDVETPDVEATGSDGDPSSTVAESDPRADRPAAKHALKQPRREAKLAARARRAEARQQLADEKARLRAEAAAAKAAEQVDSETADQVSPEVLELERPAVEVTDETVDEVVVEEVPADDLVHDARPVDDADDGRAPLELALARAASEPPVAPSEPEPEPDPRVAQHEAKVRARRDRAEAKAAARDSRIAAGQAAATERASQIDTRGSEDDPIVEPPREPRVPLAQRLRSAGRSRADAAPESGRGPAGGSTVGRGRRVVSALAVVIGAVGLVCSVILAFGALLVALGADDGSAYDLVSGIADVLVGPLRDVFSFSGSNAEMKESLVAWGAGAIIYLVVGIVAQSLLRSATDD